MSPNNKNCLDSMGRRKHCVTVVPEEFLEEADFKGLGVGILSPKFKMSSWGKKKIAEDRKYLGQ